MSDIKNKHLKNRPRKIDPKTVRMSIEPLNIVGDRVRFLCIYNGETYKLNMGNGMTRIFTADTLPDLIKENIGLINAFDWDTLHDENVGINSFAWHGAMDRILLKQEDYYPEVCADIGWRIGERYALIVPYKYFLKLKGQRES